MKYCKVCGERMEDEVNYCPKCGELAYNDDIVCCQDGEGEILSIDNPDTAVNEAMDDGFINQSMNMQQNMGMNPNMNVGMNMQQNMGMNPNMNMGMNMGMNMQQNMGMNPNMNMGVNMQQNMGMNPNMNMQQNMGMNPNMNTNMNMQRNMGMNPNMNMQQNMGMNSNMNPNMNPNMNMQQNIPNNGKNKSGKKMFVALAVIICVIGLLVAFALLMKNKGKGNEETSPQIRALNEYYEAINQKDISAINKASYPKMLLESDYLPYGYEENTNLLSVYCSQNKGLLFYRGFYEYDQFKKVQCVREAYPSIKDNLTEKQVVSRTFSNFSASYTLKSMEKVKEICADKLRKSGAVDFTSYILGNNSKNDTVITEVYLLTLNREWSYGDRLYGLDKSWWDDKEFVERAESGAFDADISTYDEAVEYFAEKEYKLLVYEYEGEWYVFDNSYKMGRSEIVVEE